jgi:hypothetical protein
MVARRFHYVMTLSCTGSGDLDLQRRKNKREREKERLGERGWRFVEWQAAESDGEWWEQEDSFEGESGSFFGWWCYGGFEEGSGRV